MAQSLVSDSKFKVYNFPPALPNKCIGCNASHPGDPAMGPTRGFIDTGMDLDWYGVVYICTLCFVEIANTFGYSSYEQYAKVLDHESDLSVQNQILREENDALRTSLRVLADHRCIGPAEPDVPSIPEGVEEQQADNTDPVDDGSEQESDNAESPDEPKLRSVRGDAKHDAKTHGGSKRKSDAISDLGL